MTSIVKFSNSPHELTTVGSVPVWRSQSSGAEIRILVELSLKNLELGNNSKASDVYLSTTGVFSLPHAEPGSFHRS